MATKSNDTDLSQLLVQIEQGKIQLPEFQRSWVWDDKKICKLLESLTSEFPMGAIMFLDYGGDLHFKYRTFTGVTENTSNIVPDYLVLDGQQRLTTLYQVLKCKNAVETRIDSNRDKIIHRYYYLDIKKCLDEEADRLDAIISVPENKILTENIGRDIILDLRNREKEYENLMFPLNITFSQPKTTQWMLELLQYYPNESQQYLQLFVNFQTKILSHILSYKIPVISLTKDTSRESVCQIFENVNTGGVPLTVFELVTAIYAADEFDLRKDWNNIKTEFTKKGEILKYVDETHFITAMTLLSSYKKNISPDEEDTTKKKAVSCKKKDVLRLTLNDYSVNRKSLIEGFIAAADFLVHQGVYTSQDLPYTTQLIPLAAIYAYDIEQTNRKLILQPNYEKLAQWYWCGVFGELYGSANEARFALDITGMFNWFAGTDIPDTVRRASFLATRLLSLKTRNSAAYKGIMALILQNQPKDFMTAQNMNVASYLNEKTDIHHIFPQAYCEHENLDEKRWNSVINKTPIYASTNRSIGGRAPSEYIKTMENKGLTDSQIKESVTSHLINYEYLKCDDFDNFIIDRASQLLNKIEKAMGKAVSGRESDETIREFGQRI